MYINSIAASLIADAIGTGMGAPRNHVERWSHPEYIIVWNTCHEGMVFVGIAPAKRTEEAIKDCYRKAIDFMAANGGKKIFLDDNGMCHIDWEYPMS